MNRHNEKDNDSFEKVAKDIECDTADDALDKAIEKLDLELEEDKESEDK